MQANTLELVGVVGDVSHLNTGCPGTGQPCHFAQDVGLGVCAVSHMRPISTMGY